MLLPSQQGVFRNIISDTSYAVKAEVTSLKDLGKVALVLFLFFNPYYLFNKMN